MQLTHPYGIEHVTLSSTLIYGGDFIWSRGRGCGFKTIIYVPNLPIDKNTFEL